MLLDFKKFYLQNGIRHIPDFLQPKFIDFNLHNLCKYSILYYTDMETYPTNMLPILKYAHNVSIVNVLEYSNPIGRFTKKRFTESNIVKDAIKKYPDAPTLLRYKAERNLTTKSNVLKDTITVYNFSLLHTHSVYSPEPLTLYKQYYNYMTTLVDNILKVDMLNTKEPINHFIQFDMPDDVYSKSVYTTHMYKDIDANTLRIFYNQKLLTLLEIFKLLGSEATKSLLHPLTTSLNLLSRVNIILRYKENNIILNLKTLLGFSKNSDIAQKPKVTSDTLMVMFINLVSALINKHEVEVNSDIISKIVAGVQNDDVSLIEDTPITIEEKDILKQISNNVVITKDTNKFVYSDITSGNQIEVTKSILDNMLTNGEIDKKKHKKLIEQMDDFANKNSPLGGGKIKDILIIKDNEVDIKPDDGEINLTTPAVTNKKDARDILSFIDKKYISEQMPKDMVRSIMKVQNAGLIVKDIEVETVDDVLGKYDIYTIQFNDKGKSTYTKKLYIPSISENGTYTMSGNPYKLERQRVELPIKKLNRTKVALTSATGKFNVTSAPLTKYDAGYRLNKFVTKLSENGAIENLLYGKANVMDTDLPEAYYLFSRYIKSFKFKSYFFMFNYTSRSKILPDVELDKIENNDLVIVGRSGKTPLLMNRDGMVFKDKDNLGSIYTILDIDENITTQYTLFSIYNTLLPTAVLLMYYKGLDGLMKLLDTEYTVLDKNPKVIEKNTMKVVLADCVILISVKTKLQKIVLEGINFKPKVIKKMTLEHLNDKNMYKIYFRELGINLVTVTNIKILENLFVDAVTETILKSMNEPTTFVGLLIRASEMLVTDAFNDPKNVETQLVRGYDRVPQLIHKALVDSIKKKTAEEHFGRSKLVIDPYVVWRGLNEDSASALVDDFNPIAYVKQNEEVTFLGTGGMSKETITIKDVGYNINDLNVISEGVKDNTDVGKTASLSANPHIMNLRGMTANKPGTETLSNLFSSNTMLAPFLLADDPKRIIYSNIQASAVIPVNNPKVFPVRTPYSNILPYKLPANFIAHCEEDGVVTVIGKHNVTIVYKSGKKQTYKFADWTSKEESNMTYVHHMRCDLVKNSKVKAGDVIYYDTGFFEKDMFDKTKVIYRVGTYVNTVMISGEYTREDSFMISNKLSEEISSETVLVNDKLLKSTDRITDTIDIGTVVTPDDTLFTIVSPLVGDEKLTKETLDLMHGFVNVAPKANASGKIIKLQVYYNCELKELSASLKKLVEQSLPYMVNHTTGKEHSGKVNSSFSINGVPLEEGGVYIKYYIVSSSNMITGDKGVFSNQLKATVTGVMDYDVVNENGDVVDAIFDYVGVYNRVVPSSDLMSSTATVLKIITDKAIEMYFK